MLMLYYTDVIDGECMGDIWNLLCGDVFLMLYFDLRPEQTCHYKVMYRKEVTHSNGQ